MHRAIAAICLLLLLVGCGLFTSKQTRALRRTPQYKAGYQDGCRSAGSPDADMREPAPQVRDDHLYETDKAYRMGWGTGYGACRSFTPRDAAPSPSRGPIPDTNPGNGGVP